VVGVPDAACCRICPVGQSQANAGADSASPNNNIAMRFIVSPFVSLRDF